MKCSWERENRVRAFLGGLTVAIFIVSLIFLVLLIFVATLGVGLTIGLSLVVVFFAWLVEAFSFCKRPAIEDYDGDEWDGARD